MIDSSISSSFAPGRPRDAAGEARAKTALRSRLFGDQTPDSSRYRFVRQVGSGGSGDVFEAFDRELQRPVAIKLLRYEGEVDDPAERLKREAKALARLAHPNIVTVFDIGTCSPSHGGVLGAEEPGTVFVVMEYVDGPTLGEWLVAETRHWREVVTMFAAAAGALAAAHAQGIVHRDFKPGNAMIGPGGRLRLLDFGLAREIDSTELVLRGEASEQSREVAADSQTLESLTVSGLVRGTPSYMAPEQHYGEPPDAQTDQFSFFVALWVGLFGERPFRTGQWKSLSAEKRRGPPPVPSSVPRWLRRLLRRGLSPSRRDRHPSMARVRILLERGLRRRAVGISVVGAGLATALAVGLGARAQDLGSQRSCLGDFDTGLWETRRARLQERYAALPLADGAQTRVLSTLDDYVAQLQGAVEEVCREPDTVVAGTRRGCLRERERAVDAVVELLATPDVGVLARGSELVARLPSVSVCGSLRPLAVRSSDDAEQQRRALLRAESLEEIGRHEEARALADAALSDADASTRARAQLLLGQVELNDGGRKPEDAEARFRRALVEAERSGDSEVAIRALTGLVHVVGPVSSEFAEAHQLAELAEAKLDLDSGGMVELRAELALEVGLTLYREYRNDEAMRQYERALALRIDVLGEQHPRTADVRVELGNVLHRLRRVEEAQTQYQQARSIYERFHGPEHPSLVGALNGLALLELDDQDYEGALARHTRIIKLSRRAHGDVHDSIAVALSNRSLVEARMGRLEAALASIDEALKIRIELLGADHIAVARSRVNRATFLNQLERMDEAGKEVGLAYEVLSAALGPEHPTLAGPLAMLAQHEMRVGKFQVAIKKFQEVVRILESGEVIDGDAVAKTRASLGIAYGHAGDLVRAQASLKRALAQTNNKGLRAAIEQQIAQLKSGDPQ